LPRREFALRSGCPSFDRIALAEIPFPGGFTADTVTFKPWVQTISTSLIHRFDWTGPVVAKY
jgi:hypothetical protein